jgi:hypothetical protein
MKLEKATVKDIDILTELRIAYLQENLGVISDQDLEVIQGSLSTYYEK